MWGWNDRKAAWKEAQVTFPEQAKISRLSYWGRLAYLCVYNGDYAYADSIASDMLKQSQWWYPSIMALAYSEQKKCDTVNEFTQLASKSPPFVHIRALYSLALCHFRDGDLQVAINALKKLQSLFDYRNSIRAAYYPKSFHLLGKIYEKKGDNELAIQNYEKFLNLWKDADQDLPDLIDAKKRLAKLKEMSNKGS